MRTTLMNSTSWTRPVWGPRGEGGGGGDDDTGGDDDSLNNDDDTGDDNDDDDDSGDDDEINDDEADALEALFKGDDDDGDDGDDSDDDDVDDEELQKGLATEMANAVKAFVIPEDMIPEDFNPSDPKQLRKVLSDVQQATMRSTMRIMFKPIQVTMERMSKDMRKTIDARITGNAGENATRDMIVEAIPVASKPGRYKVVKEIYDRALKKHKKPVAALQATKKAMKALGMPLGESNRRSDRDGRDETVLVGDDALDAFAKLPSRRNSSSTRDKVRQRLAR